MDTRKAKIGRTPGKWMAAKNQVVAHGDIVTSVQGSDRKRDNANAAFIAAAPETAEKLEQVRHALELHVAFLDSLPSGWLAHTVADIGLLNQAYLASRAVGVVSKK